MANPKFIALRVKRAGHWHWILFSDISIFEAEGLSVMHERFFRLVSSRPQLGTQNNKLKIMTKLFTSFKCHSLSEDHSFPRSRHQSIVTSSLESTALGFQRFGISFSTRTFHARGHNVCQWRQSRQGSPLDQSGCRNVFVKLVTNSCPTLTVFR